MIQTKWQLKTIFGESTCILYWAEGETYDLTPLLVSQLITPETENSRGKHMEKLIKNDEDECQNNQLKLLEVSVSHPVVCDFLWPHGL